MEFVVGFDRASSRRDEETERILQNISSISTEDQEKIDKASHPQDSSPKYMDELTEAFKPVLEKHLTERSKMIATMSDDASKDEVSGTTSFQQRGWRRCVRTFWFFPRSCCRSTHTVCRRCGTAGPVRYGRHGHG